SAAPSCPLSLHRFGSNRISSRSKKMLSLRPLWVIHVIPAIPACPVRPKSGHSAAGRVYEDTRLPIAGKQLLPAATTSARGAASCREQPQRPPDHAPCWL